jgi:Arc/MetJ-type ribon-helix-helix transcriptional regulator
MPDKMEARVPREMREEVMRIVEESHVYTSMAEFVRHAVAEKIEREEGS